MNLETITGFVLSAPVLLLWFWPLALVLFFALWSVGSRIGTRGTYVAAIVLGRRGLHQMRTWYV